MIKFNTNWIVQNQDVTTTKKIEELRSLLDGRVKAIREATEGQLQRVLASFLAYGPNEFSLALQGVPEADRELVTAMKDCVVGEVLQRTGGKTGYKVKEQHQGKYSLGTIAGDDAYFRILTTYGSIIQDESYLQVPLDQLKTLNYHPIEWVRPVKPHLQTSWIMNGNAPSLRWQGVKGDELEPTEDFEKIRSQTVFENKHFNMLPYGDDIVLGHNCDKIGLALSLTIRKMTGKVFYYSLEYQNQYGQRGVGWGSHSS